MKNEKRFRYLNGDRSIRIVKGLKAPRYIGSLTANEKYTKWKKASKKTMEELFENGVLNQSQIDRMQDSGFNAHEATIKHKIEGLNLDDAADFIKFVHMTKEDPDVLKVMSKIQTQAEKKTAQNKSAELERKIRSLDFDTIEGFKEYARLVKAEPEATQIFEKIKAQK